MVPTDLRYTKEHEWVRVEGDVATVGITDYAADQLGDIVFVELPELGPAGRAVRRRSASSSRSRPSATSSRRSAARSSRRTPRWPRTPGARQQRPVRRGLDARGSGSARSRPSSTRCSTPAAYEALDRRRRSLIRWPTARTPPSDRARMLAALGVASVDELFADIPAAVRARPAWTSRRRSTELELTARLRTLAGRNRVDLAQLPRRRRLPPLHARRSSTRSCCAASSTPPTRRTSRRSARARSRRSTSTSRSSPS